MKGLSVPHEAGRWCQGHAEGAGENTKLEGKLKDYVRQQRACSVRVNGVDEAEHEDCTEVAASIIVSQKLAADNIEDMESEMENAHQTGTIYKHRKGWTPGSPPDYCPLLFEVLS